MFCHRFCLSSVFILCFALNLHAADEHRQSLLISASDLAGQLGEASRFEGSDATVILDVRSKDAFDKQHIPHARWADTVAWRTKTFEETGLADKAYWSKEFGALGLATDATIIVAGDSLPEAARAWWLLRYAGFSNTKLLDGGYSVWTESSLPLITQTPSASYSPTTPKIEFQTRMLATLKDVKPEEISNSKCKVIDNRSDAEFSGARGVGTRTGHIPGAVHLEWSQFLNKDGTFLSNEGIDKLLKNSKLDLEQTLVTHCQTGGRSSVAAFAFELAGAQQVKNYYRGWSEYAGALTAPVEK